MKYPGVLDNGLTGNWPYVALRSAISLSTNLTWISGGVRGVTVVSRFGYPSSNPERGSLHFA